MVGQRTSKLHIRCSLSNSSKMAGTVRKIEVVFLSPPKPALDMKWNLFFVDQRASNAVPDTKAHSLSVPGSESIFQPIEFRADNSMDWQVGEYTLQVRAWIEERWPWIDDEKPSATTDQFDIVIDEKIVRDLQMSVNRPVTITVPIRGK